jgi:ABC-2 type transport system permease protein
MTHLVQKLKDRYHYSLVVLKELVKTDFKLRYQGSVLGVAWSVLQPLLLFVVMYTVFVRFLKFTDGTPTFPIVLLLGISLWNFFAEATTVGMYSIVNRGDLLRKIHFPSYIVTASATIGSLISLGINLLVVLVFSIFGGVHFTWRVLLVPFSVLQLFILALGFAMLLATLNVYFRDIGHIWEVLSQALFYAVPVIYPLSMVTAISPVFAKIMLLNPIAQTIQDIRHNLIAPETTQTLWNMVGNPWLKIIPLLLTVVIIGLGIWLFRKNSHKFAEVL